MSGTSSRMFGIAQVRKHIDLSRAILFPVDFYTQEGLLNMIADFARPPISEIWFMDRVFYLLDLSKYYPFSYEGRKGPQTASEHIFDASYCLGSAVIQFGVILAMYNLDGVSARFRLNKPTCASPVPGHITITFEGEDIRQSVYWDAAYDMIPDHVFDSGNEIYRFTADQPIPLLMISCSAIVLERGLVTGVKFKDPSDKKLDNYHACNFIVRNSKLIRFGYSNFL